jgi:hypothetical protein
LVAGPGQHWEAELSVASPENPVYPGDWPPASFADNDHILVWWLPEYDDLLRQLIRELQWAWTSEITQRLEKLVPEAVLIAWRDVDPLCREFTWYNVLHFFAVARAKQLGLHLRSARSVACSCCSRQFLESQLAHRLILRVGADGIDVCEQCLRQALQEPGSEAANSEQATAVLQALTKALQHPLRQGDLTGRIELKGLLPEARALAVQALRVKPTIAQVKRLFGSWEAALAHAVASPPTPLPRPKPTSPPEPDRYFTRPSSPDVRTTVPGPDLYEPLPTLPRGNVRFVLVGGPMEYVDRRGQHECISGRLPIGGKEEEFAENVARVNAMVDGSPWVRASAEIGHAILASLARVDREGRPSGFTTSHVTSTYREAIKGVTGSPPKKNAEEEWRVGPPGKSGWSYSHGAENYVRNAYADFSLITVDPVPAVCIWGWPDRSDLFLQAFLDTIAFGAMQPVTVILPDVPAYRSFARRYAQKERLDQVVRALLEESFYQPMDGGTPFNARGDVYSAEFAPRLLVQPDGTVLDGAALASALVYLSAHHTLRLSVWDVLGDPLLRAAATATPVAPRSFTSPASERNDMVRWYAQKGRWEDPNALLRPYSPGTGYSAMRS